jgi:hypothetical protein
VKLAKRALAACGVLILAGCQTTPTPPARSAMGPRIDPPGVRCPGDAVPDDAGLSSALNVGVDRLKAMKRARDLSNAQICRSSEIRLARNYIYLMSGTAIMGEGFLRTVADTRWEIKGVGDFDGDGKADIAWRHSQSGENYLYPMDGTTIKPTEGFLRTVADLDWKIVAVGDYDGDGKSDLLWRHASTGQNYLYPMDGTAIKPSEGFLRTVPPGSWAVAAP